MIYPKISIVTPSLNQGEFIEQTIQSIITQNYPDLEYIIIDGGSTDNTLDIIKKYEQHITYWVSEPDGGQTDAINKGFAKCTGEIFNWINSDDFYEPGTLIKLGSLFFENPSTEVICGKEWCFENNDLTKKKITKGSIIKKDVYETIREGIINQPCTFFRTKYIQDFFPLPISLNYVMDRQLWWSYLFKYGQKNILQTNNVLTNFRIHPNSKSGSEQAGFEKEFEKLKLTLLLQLKAPEILIDQLDKNIKPLTFVWNIYNHEAESIVAPFATFYAERNYVANNLNHAAELMKYVKKYKYKSITLREWKLWFLTNVIPHSLLKLLKSIKKKILFL